jgi:hypothetical protein
MIRKLDSQQTYSETNDKILPTLGSALPGFNARALCTSLKTQLMFW